MWVKQKEGQDNSNVHSLKYNELEYIFWVVLIISGGNNLLFYPFSSMVIPFLDFKWDHCKIEMTYIKDQVIPSPIGMCSYEIIDLFLPSIRTDIFTNHHLISVGNEPCIGGLRVTAYLEIMRIRHIY